MEPHLVRAQSAYKDIMIHSFYHTHTHTHTRTRTRTHTHRVIVIVPLQQLVPEGVTNV